MFTEENAKDIEMAELKRHTEQDTDTVVIGTRVRREFHRRLLAQAEQLGYTSLSQLVLSAVIEKMSRLEGQSIEPIAN